MVAEVVYRSVSAASSEATAVASALFFLGNTSAVVLGYNSRVVASTHRHLTDGVARILARGLHELAEVVDVKMLESGEQTQP